jgi:hypothetical protein
MRTGIGQPDYGWRTRGAGREAQDIERATVKRGVFSVHDQKIKTDATEDFNDLVTSGLYKGANEPFP